MSIPEYSSLFLITFRDRYISTEEKFLFANPDFKKNLTHILVLRMESAEMPVTPLLESPPSPNLENFNSPTVGIRFILYWYLTKLFICSIFFANTSSTVLRDRY